MPNFTYTRDIPDGPHNPSVDQPDMKTNNNSIDDIIEIDHYSFNDNLGGYHKQVDLVNKASPYLTPAGVGSVLLSDFNEWIFTNASLSPAGIQMTSSAAPPVNLTRGSSFLPGGIVIQWGSGVTIAGGVFNDTLIYPYSTLFCAFSSALNIAGIISNVTVISPNVSVFARNTSNTAVVGATVCWFAIGIL